MRPLPRAALARLSSPRIWTPTGFVSAVDVQWACKLDWHASYELFDPQAFELEQWRHLMRLRARAWLEQECWLPITDSAFVAGLGLLIGGTIQDFTNKDTFTAADAGSSYLINAFATWLRLKGWGGGGGGGGTNNAVQAGHGGGAGFAQCDINVTPGETLTKRVAGGGAGGVDAQGAGAGGGYSAVLRGATFLMQAPGAGGGGGSQLSPNVGGNGGVGGPATGGAGVNGVGDVFGGGGGGGTPSAGGAAGLQTTGFFLTAGAANQGGNGGCRSNTAAAEAVGGLNGGGDGGSAQASLGGASGGGGGGGKFGGGGGGAASSNDGGGGGGGGSDLVTGFNFVETAGSGRNAGNNADADYGGNAGLGGQGFATANTDGTPGNPGRLVLAW